MVHLFNEDLLKFTHTSWVREWIPSKRVNYLIKYFFLTTNDVSTTFNRNSMNN